MRAGQMVKLRAYGGKELVRYIIGIDKQTVVVCSPEEYKLAQSEKREPKGVGFNINNVITEMETV